ncbi:type VI secretion system protein TssA [Roseibium sp. RKSG952]|uniref:type VI secretion system protein TssA n=1 Tax=Roseibium sp. RKSG952 TaxID=2529384 RepID=UPI0012BC0AAC|nr:type VI secretion system protein TssA [Roseibium sp. RKSG952]MTI00416.1 type VI secretion system protein TssA [Roseibium sp. RKSG952]
MLDLDSLLQCFGEDTPCGEDLEYDPEFTDLELANQPGEEKVSGDAVIPAEEPDFAAVKSAAIALLGRTKDLRVAAILANASLKTDGLPAFAETLRYVRRCLEKHWEHVHPQLDPDDDDDPTIRINAVLGLADRASILSSLRGAALTESRAFGRFGLRDVLIADGELSPPSETADVPTPQVIAAAFQDTDPDHLAALSQTVRGCLDEAKAIAAVFDDRIGAHGPDLDPLVNMLHDIARRLEPYLTDEATASPIAPSTPVEPMQAHAVIPASPALAAPGAINSPEDVKRIIDKIVDYYARNEPSSPVPLLLTRARRLVSADFFTIMKDMAPQGVENVSLIGGIDEDADD